jgi:hypothetical protein
MLISTTTPWFNVPVHWRNDITRTYNSTGDSNYNDIGFANLAGTNVEDFDLVNQGSPAYRPVLCRAYPLITCLIFVIEV